MKILTFDIEDWYHLLDIPETSNPESWASYTPRIHANVDLLLESIERHGHRATFFCLGWVAERYPEIIRSIDAAGFEIASHTYSHQLAYKQTRHQFKVDVTRSIEILENITGKKVKCFRAPGFSIISGMSWAFETLLDLGIEFDSSIFPAARSHGGFADFGTAKPAIIECKGMALKEFPISLGNLFGRKIVFSGGGYFRLLPYHMIQWMAKQSDYMMTYFHPRDFDVGQPMLHLPLHRSFKSYVGLKSAYSKFERLMANHAFTDLRAASAIVNWQDAPRVLIA